MFFNKYLELKFIQQLKINQYVNATNLGSVHCQKFQYNNGFGKNCQQIMRHS